jgi:5-methylcytosine-specific restriction protein A
MPSKIKTASNKTSIKSAHEIQRSVDRSFYQSKEWRTLRAQHLRENPCCEMCRPIVTPAVIVHHIIEVKDDPTKALDPENLLSCCVACHNTIHKKQEDN